MKHAYVLAVILGRSQTGLRASCQSGDAVLLGLVPHQSLAVLPIPERF